jgi:hypothetical protein
MNMTSRVNTPKNAQGNAFVYILIAIALLGSLTFTLYGSEDTAGVSDLNEGRSTIAVNEILSYAAAAQNAIASLDRVGTGAGAIDFVMPSQTVAFNAAPHINKLFHPDGGGLSYKLLPQDAAVAGLTNPAAGYYIGRFSNTEWSPTTANDVIFAAYGINRQVCQDLNLKVLGTAAPLASNSDVREYLVDIAVSGSGSNDDLDLGSCAACEEISSACVTNGGVYAFYAVLVAR